MPALKALLQNRRRETIMNMAELLPRHHGFVLVHKKKQSPWKSIIAKISVIYWEYKAALFR